VKAQTDHARTPSRPPDCWQGIRHRGAIAHSKQMRVDVIGLQCAPGPAAHARADPYIEAHRSLTISGHSNARSARSHGNGRGDLSLERCRCPGPVLQGIVEEFGVTHRRCCCGTTPEHLSSISPPSAICEPQRCRTMCRRALVPPSAMRETTLRRSPRRCFARPAARQTPQVVAQVKPPPASADDMRAFRRCARAAEDSGAHVLDPSASRSPSAGSW